MKAQNAGHQFFGQWLHQIDISFSQPGWKDSLFLYENINDTAENQIYLRGQVVLDGVTYHDIGLKYKGNSSYNIPSDKKSFKLSFDKFVNGQKPDGLKKINLNNAFKDPTFLREKFSLDFLNAEGLHAPRCVYAQVSINGQTYGLYTVVEEVDDAPFLLNHFANKTGNLFKGDPHGNLTWKGNNPAQYHNDYELHTNEDVNDWSDLINLIHVINNSPASSLESELNPLLNIPAYLAHRAFNLLFVNLDSYDGSGHNYYMYNNQGRFEWIAWDLNEAVGNFNMGMSVPQLECLSAFFIPPPQNQRPLPTRLFASGTTYRSYYAYLLGQWLQKWPPARFEAWVDSMAAVIRPYVYADPMKFYTNAQFESNLLQNTVLSGPGLPGGTFLTPGLKSFYANRWQCLQSELQSLEYWHLAPEKEAYSVKVFPNPAVEDLRIVGLKGPVQQIFISDAQGRMLTPKTWAEFKNSENSISLSISSLSPGLYQIHILYDLYDENWHSARFLKL
ncbi:MAG: CotH kinase family protein [Flavobacteriales bacterium]|nr:CotH kinase family protein [Flavobacteriales bacterium]